MQQQPQKQHSSFKNLYRFLRQFSEVFSKDPRRRAEAIQQSTDNLRQVAKPGRESQIEVFEDIMRDMDEVVRAWPQHSVPDKRIAAGFLAFNLVLLPVILSWGKPNTLSGVIALMAIIVSLMFNIVYLLICFNQERQGTINAGCGLSFMEYVFGIGTACVALALLWTVFPPAIIVLVIGALIALFIWNVNVFRNAIIAAHLRRFPPPQSNQQSPTSP